MRILFVTHAYPPHGSGVGSFVQAAARGLVARGHQVWVVEAYHPGHGRPVGDRVDEGVDVRVFGEDFPPFRWMSGRSAAARTLLWTAYKTKLFFLLFLLQSWRCGQWVRRLADRLDIDVVEVADGNESGLLASIAGRAALVVRAHGSVHLQEAVGVKAFPPLERWVYRRIERGAMRRADAVVGVSAFVANLTRRLFHLSQAVPVIYNLVETPPGGPFPHDEQVVLFVGRIGADKGADTVAKAWNIAAPQLPGIRLEFLGAGDASVVLNELDESVRPTVLLPGLLPREEIFRRLAHCRLFVLPSRFETFGIALVEAMATGCPVIHTTRCSGPEIVDDGVDGLLIDPDDADALAAAMVRVLSDASLREHLAAGAKLKAASFAHREAWLDANEAFYRCAIQVRAAGRD